MNQDPQQPRTGLILAGSVAALIATVMIAAGAFALWGDSKKDADGYLSTGTERFTTTTRALASERLDIEIDGKHWIAGVEDLGDSRLKVTSANGEPVFAGIAPKQDVDAYLRGVEHTVVADIDTAPFSARHREMHSRPPRRVPAPPAEQDIWAASVGGSGTQSLHWTPDDGDWSVVVMNADGSRGVDAGISAGARVAFLGTLGWVLVGIGGALTLAAAALLFAGGRPPRPRAEAPALAPAAA